MNPDTYEELLQKNETKKKKWLIIAGALFIICTSTLLVLLLVMQNNGPQGAKIKQIQRDGYENVPASIVDPAPLTETPNTAVINFAETPVIPACSIITLTDLKKANLLLAPQASGLSRSYFDGQGVSRLDLSDALSLPNEPSNSCQYLLYPSGDLSLTTYQSAYTNTEALQRELTRRYTPQNSLNGIKIFSRNAEGAAKNMQKFDYFFQKDTITVHLLLNTLAGPSAETTKQRVIESIVNGIYRSHSGPSKLAYDSPVFKASFLNACSLLDVKDISQLFEEEAAPYISEKYSTAIGLINFSLNDPQQKDGNDYAFIDHECTRATAKSNGDRALTIYTKNFTTDQAAKLAFSRDKVTDEGQNLSSSIANESYLVMKEQTRSRGSIVFRKDRFIVEVRLVDRKFPSSTTDPQFRSRALLPITQAISSRINL